MRSFIIILTLFIFSSFAKDEINLEGKIKKEFFLTKKDINRPAGVFVKLFSWVSKKSEHCIVYKTPIKRRKGALYLIETKDCMLSKSDLKVFEDNIDQLSIEKNDNSIILSFSDKKKIFMFPYNSHFKYLKLKEDVVSNIEVGTLCRKFSNSCLDKVIDKCDQCVGDMWTAELNWRCSKRSERRCGNFRCGHKNESACMKFLPNDSSISCFDASKYVYCQKGLSHFCEGDGRIICR